MLKALNPSKLRRLTGKKISVKTFPGATTSDMNHYIKPTLDRNPELLVLHVGTNDVQRKEPQEIANEVKSLCRSIVRNGMTRIALSEIVQRQDEDLNIKIRKTNLRLAEVCKTRQWHFISHANIDYSHLNASGLHLNVKDTIAFAKNYADFLNNC